MTNFDKHRRDPCMLCGQCPQEETVPGGEEEYGGRDPCLPGKIPGVSHACCGHGVIERAYVTLGGEPGQSVDEVETVTLRGVKALIFFGLVAAAMRGGDTP